MILIALLQQDAWYYDELELQAMDGFDDVDPDSDYDYEETYKKRKKRGGPGKPPKNSNSDSPHGKKGPKVIIIIIKISLFFVVGWLVISFCFYKISTTFATSST